MIGSSTFTDGSRLPLYVDGLSPMEKDLVESGHAHALDEDGQGSQFAFGQSGVQLRGVDKVVDDIERKLARSGPDFRPAAQAEMANDLDLIGKLRSAMLTGPKTFAGEGRDFVYRTESGRLCKLQVTLQNYGVWERFSDNGTQTRIDNAQRGEAAIGDSKTINQTRQLSPGAPIGPAAAPFAAIFGRVLARVGWLREFTYNMHDQVMSQSETRVHDHSHLHLDDVYYSVEVSDALAPLEREAGRFRLLSGRALERPEGTSSWHAWRAAGWRSRPARDAGGVLRFGFAVHNGISVRIADGMTSSDNEATRVPSSLLLGPDSDYRFVITEAFGPTRAMRDWAIGKVGADPGSTAYAELDAFFSSNNLHRLAGRLSRSMVATEPLFADDKKHTPLGAFIVERVVPGRAVLFDTIHKAELRDTAQLSLHNTRKQTKANTTELGGFVGLALNLPTFGLSDALSGLLTRIRPRLQFGPGARFSYARGRSVMTGGTGAVKTVGKAKDAPTMLFKVEKTIYLRKTGDVEPTAFRTWSLDRMTYAEARRLAGWDDGSRLRKENGAEPHAPAYLTADHPPTLGMSRVVQFLFPDGSPTRSATTQSLEAKNNWINAFTQQVLEAVSRKYPGMVAPLDQLGDPTDDRWRNRDHYQMVLHNTLTIISATSWHATAGNLRAGRNALTLDIGLLDPGRFTRGYRTITIRADLTGRRYEGRGDAGVMFSAPGTTNVDASHYSALGFEAAVQGQVSLRDTDLTQGGPPYNGLMGRIGYQRNTSKRTESGYGHVATFDPTAVTLTPGHLFSYEIALSLSTGGYWRFRSLLRGILSLGFLGTQLFVFRAPETNLIGGDSSVPPVTGRVLLSVPVEHCPVEDPHAWDAQNPYKSSDHITQGEMPRRQAKALTSAALTSDEAVPDALADVPHQTVAVVAPPDGQGVIEKVLNEASHGQWQMTYHGERAHDAAQRPLRPQYLAANFDQSATATGSRTTGLFGKGPYVDWMGTVVHRVRVSGLQALGAPARMSTELTLGAGTRASGSESHQTAAQVAIAAQYRHRHGTSPNLISANALSWAPWIRAWRRGSTVYRSVRADVNRVDNGFQVPVAGDIDHEIAAEVRNLGPTAPFRKLVRNWHDWAGRWQHIQGGWIGHLPERIAHRLRLVDGDELGDGPVYTGRHWRKHRWYQTHPFAAYPINTPDTAAALNQFDAMLREQGVDSDSREAVRRLASARVVRALRRQMGSTGASITARAGGPGGKRFRLGGRDAVLRVQIIPAEDGQLLERIWPATEVEDHRFATETLTGSLSVVNGQAAGAMFIGAPYTGDPSNTVSAVGPSVFETGTNRRLVSAASSLTVTRHRTVCTKEPHAEFATRYRIVLTLEVGRTRGKPRAPGTRTVRYEQEIGSMRELVPLSLLRPGTSSRTLPPPELTEAETEVRVLSGTDSPVSVADGIQRWRTSPQARAVGEKDNPLVFPDRGVDIVSIVGADSIAAAGQLALGRAFDNRLKDYGGRLTGERLQEALRKARVTPLTAPGTGSAQTLDDGNSISMLAGFGEQLTSPDGYAIAGLSEVSLADESSGELTQYSRSWSRGAMLLGVADNVRMEATTIYSQGNKVEADVGGSEDVAIGAAPTIKSDPTGTNYLTMSGTGADTGETDGRVITNDQSFKVNVKPAARRAFAFAIPTDFLTVASVHRQFKESPVATWIRTNLMGPFAGAAPGVQAVESSGHILAWVREDVARDLGLVTDDNFPEQVAKAWDDVNDANSAWDEADAEYWRLRRKLPELHAELSHAISKRETAERQVQGTEHALRAAELAASSHYDAAVAKSDRLSLEEAEGRTAEASQELHSALLAELQHHEADSPDSTAAGDRVSAARRALEAATAEAERLRQEWYGSLKPARDAREAHVEPWVKGLQSARDAHAATLAAVRRAQVRLDERLRAVDGQRALAERAADAMADLRAAADQLTHWHRLPDDPGTHRQPGAPIRGGVSEPQMPDFAPPEKAGESSSEPPPVYTVLAQADSTRCLMAPDGSLHGLQDVPRDGRSFLHALSVSFEDLPRSVRDGQVLPADPETLGNRLADQLAALPDDSPLLAFLTPDELDTFSSAELATVGLDLGADTPERREFDALGLIPHSAGDLPASGGANRSLSHARRRDLAVVQLRRASAANDVADGSGKPHPATVADRAERRTRRLCWDHGAADVQPALAALMTGVVVRIVREDGSFLEFSPSPGDAPHADAPRVVLYLGDRHYQAVRPQALDERQLSPFRPHVSEPAVRDDALPSHERRPWIQPPLEGEPYPAPPRFDAATNPRLLTAPGGHIYDLHEPAGSGNGFYGGIVNALVAAGAKVSDVPGATALLRTRTLTNHPLRADARLDPRATFTSQQLAAAGIVLTPEQDVAQRHSGRLPASFTPDTAQRDRLIRFDLFNATCWNAHSTLLAADLLARTMELELTIVHEDGTFDTFGDRLAPDARVVVLYQRGRDFLAATPREPNTPRVPFASSKSPVPPSPVHTDTSPPPSPDGGLVLLPATGPAGGKGEPKWSALTSTTPAELASVVNRQRAPLHELSSLPGLSGSALSAASEKSKNPEETVRPVAPDVMRASVMGQQSTDKVTGVEDAPSVEGPLADYADLLDGLRADEPALRDGPLNLEKIIRHVLLLSPRAVINDSHHVQLGSLVAQMQDHEETAPSLKLLTGLYLLRRGVSGVLDYALDIDTFAARVLHLSSPDPARRRELRPLIEEARAAGFDISSTAQLSAFDLKRTGHLTSATLLRDSRGKAIGREWNPVSRMLPETELVRSLDNRGEGDTQLRDLETQWPGFWAVRLNGPPSGAQLASRWPDEDIAALLTHDPELGLLDPGVAIMLLLPSGESADLPSVLQLRSAIQRQTGRLVAIPAPQEAAPKPGPLTSASAGGSDLQAPQGEPRVGITPALRSNPNPASLTTEVDQRPADTQSPSPDRPVPLPRQAPNHPPSSSMPSDGEPTSGKTQAGLSSGLRSAPSRERDHQAWREYDEALANFRDENADAEDRLRNAPPGEPEEGNWASFEDARARVEAAEARLHALGVGLAELVAVRTAVDVGSGSGGSTDSGYQPGRPLADPRVPRNFAHRRWLARTLTVADLPTDLEFASSSERALSGDIDSAGLTLSRDQHIELILSGGRSVGMDGFDTLSQTRLRMLQAHGWTPQLETAAANTARRLWNEAKQEFLDAASAKSASDAPEAVAEINTEAVWAAATTLVLPLELHEVLADSRYAEADFRKVVRQVANELLKLHGRDATASYRTADALRHSVLGLRKRWLPTAGVDPGTWNALDAST
ncbi:hypothetical protein ACIP5U_39285 [Streptomyces sp. NPDC088788]|uniref:hypothetical protein n=1 Tax=Streptomyces sp. NPDC088788 TaxID=3365898 RepID=UPI003821F212